MKRHHRGNVLDRHDRANDSHNRRRREPQTTARDDDNPPNKEDPPQSKLDGLRGILPKETTVGQLSSRTDFIQQWLLQTDEEANRKRPDSRTAQEKPTPVYVEPKTLVETGPRYPVLDAGSIGEQSWRKRKHHTSSDSSLLEVPDRPKPQPPAGSDFGTDHAAQKDASDLPGKRRRTGGYISEVTTPSSTPSISKRDTFKKRARHKTKEDRYETKKKAEKRPKDGHDKKPRKKKEKRADRKKTAKKAGGDLMRNFSSKSIGQERLTIRPSHGLGLFRNGRASSPVQRRGIPDLAFSEMDFLQRSNKYTSSMKDDKISSKSQVEEKGNPPRGQDEISTFFKSSKLPMQRTPLNRRIASSSNQATDLRSRSYVQLDSGYSEQDENSGSFDVAARSSLDFGRKRHAADIPSAFSGRSPVVKEIWNVLNSASKLSGIASTYISRSETHVSRQAKPQDWQEINRTRASSTPESIRRSLEETGVFRDTGIDLIARHAGRPPHVHEKPSQHERTKHTDMLGSTEKAASPAQTQSHAVAPSHASNQPPLEEGTNASDAKDGEVSEGMMKRERLVIEHFDAKLGWHERSEPGKHEQVFTTTVRKGEISEQSRSAPIDRLERARFARVNRPSTTIPIRQPLISMNDATAKKPLHGQSQTSTETYQHTSPRDIAAMSSPARDYGITLDLSNQATVRMQHKEPDQFTFFSHAHSRVNEQLHEDIRSGKEVHAPLVPQVRPAEMNQDESATLHKTTDLFCENALSYQEPPVRGFSASRGISETYHHHNARSSLQADNEPSFVHQLPRYLMPYDPSVYRDHSREMEYEELNIITHTNASIEPADFQNRNQFVGEGYIFIDDGPQHAYEGYDFHGGGHLESESWNLGSGDVDSADEHYRIEAPGPEPYDDGQMMVGVEEQHLHIGHFSPAEQGEGYEQYLPAANDQEQAFWRPHQQY